MIFSLEMFGTLLEDVSLKDFCTYKIGGKAKGVFFPDSLNNLLSSLEYLKQNEIKYMILGNGSNVIFSDDYYDGIIIKLTKMNNVIYSENDIYAEAGIMMPKLCTDVINHGFSGLEWSSGIPGTLGGCIVGNAGAYNEFIMDYVTYVKVLDANGNIMDIPKDKINYSYRYTNFKDNKNFIIIGAGLNLSLGNKEESLRIVRDRLKRRMDSQPLEYPSAGSVFRNPSNDFAGRIIEEDVNLKGYKLGGAMVSDKHANFIINYDNAKASDVRNLIMYIKEKVKEKDNIDLIVEQEFINWE